MRILALDLSTRAGWAVLEDGKLLGYGLIEQGQLKDRPYPYDLIDRARLVADRVIVQAARYSPDVVVIEETNQGGFGSSRDAQKILEWIHLLVADGLRQFRIRYLATSAWHKRVGLALTKDQRAHNKLRKTVRDQAMAALLTQIQAQVYAERPLPSLDRKAVLAHKKENTAEVKRRLREATRRIQIDGPGRVTNKHLAVARANALYQLELKQKDENEADAILLAHAAAAELTFAPGR